MARLRYESTGARLALADQRLGPAYAGADPARPPVRVNPRPRYLAMEHIRRDRPGGGGPGDDELDSGAVGQPAGGAAGAVAGAGRAGLSDGPTLVAIAASSSWLHGRDSGWKSSGSGAWSGLDARTCGPVPGCAPGRSGEGAEDPALAWARFAMRAPVTFVQAGGEEVRAVGHCVPSSSGLAGM